MDNNSDANDVFADDTQAETKIEPKTKKKEKVVGDNLSPTTFSFFILASVI